jgi:hypothetical protein
MSYLTHNAISSQIKVNWSFAVIPVNTSRLKNPSRISYTYFLSSLKVYLQICIQPAFHKYLTTVEILYYLFIVHAVEENSQTERYYALFKDGS